MTSVGIQAIFTPGGKSTRTGVVKDVVSRPLPSSPCPPRPQAHTLPLDSSAYSAAFELPTCVTVPGRVIVTGRTWVSALAFESSKNDPQCRTVATGDAASATTADDAREAGAGREEAAWLAGRPGAHPTRTTAVTTAAARPVPASRELPEVGR